MNLKGSLRSNDATATRMSDNDRFHKQDNTIFLFISLPFFHNEEVKMPNDLRFMENVNKERCFFFFFFFFHNFSLRATSYSVEVLSRVTVVK